MKFGLRDEDLKLLEELLFKPLREQHSKIWIFGSRARGDHKPFSDIDILYQLPEKHILSLSDLSDIKEKLEQSNLPYKVDIVNIEDLAESYREGIIKNKVLISPILP